MAFRYVPFDPVSVVARRFAFAHKSALTLQSQLGPSAVRGATPHAAWRAEGRLSSSSELTSAFIWTVVLRTPGSHSAGVARATVVDLRNEPPLGGPVLPGRFPPFGLPQFDPLWAAPFCHLTMGGPASRPHMQLCYLVIDHPMYKVDVEWRTWIHSEVIVSQLHRTFIIAQQAMLVQPFTP